MSGLKIGEIVFDPRCFVYLPGLKSLVCAGLLSCIPDRQTQLHLEYALEHYAPDNLLILGPVNPKADFADLARRIGDKIKPLIVTEKPDPQACFDAESLGFEVHQELVWDKYRFKEAEEIEENPLGLRMTTFSGGAEWVQYQIRVGKNPLKGHRLPVFLRGPGKVILPTLNPKAESVPVLDVGLNDKFGSKLPERFHRFDVFAAGHARILPLGKITDLERVAGVSGGIPLNKDTLGGSLDKRRRYAKQLV